MPTAEDVSAEDAIALGTNAVARMLKTPLIVTLTKGGFTARKVAALSEWFNVKTAWHGPGDVSPVGHCANLSLDIASYNFGIQEQTVFGKETQGVFPGCPKIKDGYFWVNEAPGWGMDLDEKLAMKFPPRQTTPFDYSWGQTRRRDGTIVRP